MRKVYLICSALAAGFSVILAAFVFAGCAETVLETTTEPAGKIVSVSAIAGRTSPALMVETETGTYVLLGCKEIPKDAVAQLVTVKHPTRICRYFTWEGAKWRYFLDSWDR